MYQCEQSFQNAMNNNSMYGTVLKIENNFHKKQIPNCMCSVIFKIEIQNLYRIPKYAEKH